MSAFERKIPRVSIVIPSWFSKDMHGRYGEHETFHIASLCMKRLKETIDETVELIVVDNGSTLTDEDVKSNPEIQLTPSWYWAQADVLIKNPKNLGFAPSVNQGIALSRGEYVVQANNDMFMWQDWIQPMIDVLENTELNPRAALVMPNLIKSQYQKGCLREDGKKLDTFKVMALKKEEINYPHKDVIETGAEFGSFYMGKRVLFEEMKRKDGYILDEGYLVGGKEDRDIYRRFRAMGFETYRTNHVRAMHVGNLTINHVPDKKVYTEANRIKFEAKYGFDDTTKKLSIG